MESAGEVDRNISAAERPLRPFRRDLGDTIVVGAPNDDHFFSDQGSAYVFVRNNGSWSLMQQLLANDAAASDWFGFSVAIDGYTGSR